MSSSKSADTDESASEELGQSPAAAGAGGEGEKPPERLNLEVSIDKRGACQRHVTAVIPREDIDRYFDKAYSELVGKAAVPGFRAGRAPRKLVEARFKKDVTDQVKGTLLIDTLDQVTQDHKLAVISEPDVKPEAIQFPDEGPLTFEFDLEVRPEFDLPPWKGLVIEKPVREVTPDDVEQRLKKLLAQHGRLVPHDGPAAAGDYLSCNVAFRHGDQVLGSATEQVIRLQPVLSFRDGKIEKFDQLVVGARAGESRQGTVKLTMDAPNRELRGQQVLVTLEVLEVKKLQLPELAPALLEELGGFESEEDLRATVAESLRRQVVYQQQQRARQQVLGALTVAADWDLPPDLLKRQSRRELERSVLELRRSGYSDAEIRAHENELRQNSQQVTTRALKEHFVLERIAEEEKISDEPQDYDLEISLIAAQSSQSTRRVRAQLEKRGLMDTLRNQIIERKTLELILSHATFMEVPFLFEAAEAEALDLSAGGGEDEPEIPEAQPDSESARGLEHAHEHGHEHDHDHDHG